MSCIQIGLDGCYDFHSCGCRITSDELETADHVPLELIPASPNSADRTLLMSTLKSYTKNMMPRTDHVIPVPAAHVLDENASPDPQPIPTTVNNYNCMDIGSVLKHFTHNNVSN